MRARIALAVPLHAGLGVIAIRGHLHDGARSVLIEPAEHAQELLVATVSPKRELVRFDGVHAELGTLAAFHPLRPHIAKQAIGEQPELIRCCAVDLDSDALGAEPGLVERDAVPSRFDVRDHFAPRGRVRDRYRFPVPIDLDRHIGDRHVSLIADESNQHGDPFQGGLGYSSPSSSRLLRSRISWNFSVGTRGSAVPSRMSLIVQK